MCTLVPEVLRTRAARTARAYAAASLFCLVFGAVYEFFSHGVWSYGMVYAFVFPLFGGALPWGWMARRTMPPRPCPACQFLWGAGIAAFTVGSLVYGVLAIYGTSSRLTKVYFTAGSVLLTAALFARLIYFINRKRT